MNDEQLSQPSNLQAEQDNGAQLEATNGTASQSPEVLAGRVGTAQVGDIDGPTTGAPMPIAEGHPAPTPSTNASSSQPSASAEQAEAETSYHPAEPVGETVAEAGEARASGAASTGAAQGGARLYADPVGRSAGTSSTPSAPSASGAGAAEAPSAGEEDSDELQVVRTTRDRRLNEMAPNASMEDLLRASEQQYRSLKHGDVLEGTVMKVDRDEILVDIGSKSEGIVPSHELQSLTEEERTAMQIGDEILVSVVQPENAEGHAILSLDRARQEKSWRDLQKKFEAGEIITAPVSGYNKGGLLVNLGGVRGFVPASQVSSIPPSEMNKQAEMAKLQGTGLPLKIIEINRGRNRLILSERQAVQEQRESVRSRLLRELEPGQIRTGTVSSICDFGAFVDIGGADGLIHLSELSWKRVSHPSDVLKPGDHIQVYVLSVDPNERKIALSLKRTQPEPWSTITDNYHIGQIVRGTITQLTNFGAFARLEDGIEGLIHVSELAEGRVAHPKNVVHEGEVLDLKVIRIDAAKKRIGLSLKRVNEDNEGGAAGPVDEDTAEEIRSGTSPQASNASGSSLADVVPQREGGQSGERSQSQQFRERAERAERSERGDRDRDRESNRAPQTQVGNFQLPSTGEEEPMGIMAQAFAALAQRTRTSQQDEADETEETTPSASTSRGSRSGAQAEAMMPASEDVAGDTAQASAAAETTDSGDTNDTNDTGGSVAAPEASEATAEAAPETSEEAGEADTADTTEEAGEADTASAEATEEPTDSGDTAEAYTGTADTQSSGEDSGADLSTGGPGTSEVLSESSTEDTVTSGGSGSEGAPSIADSTADEGSLEAGTEGETGEDETLG